MTNHKSNISPKAKLIYLVEDTPSAQFLYEEVIRSIGCKSRVFATAELFLDFLKKSDETPDLILMDIGLPGINGAQCLKKIRSTFLRLTQVPIVAITAHVMLNEIKQYEKQGFDKVLQKPVKCADLKEIIFDFSVKKLRVLI